MRPDAIQAIKALKPYKGGNDTLWKLHKLDNTDKHRLVLTVAAAFAGTKVGGLARYLKQLGEAVVPPFNDESFRLIFRSHMRICPLEKGEILITDATPGAEPNPDIEFDIEVAISEPEVVECEPLLPTLQQMTDLVEKIVAIFAPLLEP
jgi:hypothetical protein